MQGYEMKGAATIKEPLRGVRCSFEWETKAEGSTGRNYRKISKPDDECDVAEKVLWL